MLASSFLLAGVGCHFAGVAGVTSGMHSVSSVFVWPCLNYLLSKPPCGFPVKVGAIGCALKVRMLRNHERSHSQTKLTVMIIDRRQSEANARTRLDSVCSGSDLWTSFVPSKQLVPSFE